MHQLGIIFRFAAHCLKSIFSSSCSTTNAHVMELSQCIQKSSTNIAPINALRKKLLTSSETITTHDIGSRSLKYTSDVRSIKDIVRYSSITPKAGHILYEVTKHTKPDAIIELGTSVGISTAYLALAAPYAQIYTIEGCPEKFRMAQENFALLSLTNIESHNGSFETALPGILQKCNGTTLVFIDGNHTYEATLTYFDTCIKHLNSPVIILHDIHLTRGMHTAWLHIQSHYNNIVMITLFNMGIILSGNANEHFYILKNAS